ncbi:MAG: hypothetical protein KIS67_13765 [Verrucomicrobiae bacterium]|nr:hypothetical protein [Verrucomicrobiae bacterium]
MKTPPARKEQELSDLPALKNDILNVLRMQNSPPPGFTDTLISIWSNPAQDVVLRDYALQHLFVWYEQGALDAADARTEIEDTLFGAACQFNSLAGTALLGLHRLSAADPAFSHGEINRLALRLIQSPATDLATRITAIQICAERGLKEALPAIEAVAQASDCVPLRLSASAATTRLSGEERDWRLGPWTGGQFIGTPAGLAATLGPAPRDGPYE